MGIKNFIYELEFIKKIKSYFKIVYDRKANAYSYYTVNLEPIPGSPGHRTDDTLNRVLVHHRTGGRGKSGRDTNPSQGMIQETPLLLESTSL